MPSAHGVGTGAHAGYGALVGTSYSAYAEAAPSPYIDGRPTSVLALRPAPLGDNPSGVAQTIRVLRDRGQRLDDSAAADTAREHVAVVREFCELLGVRSWEDQRSVLRCSCGPSWANTFAGATSWAHIFQLLQDSPDDDGWLGVQTALDRLMPVPSETPARFVARAETQFMRAAVYRGVDPGDPRVLAAALRAVKRNLSTALGGQALAGFHYPTFGALQAAASELSFPARATPSPAATAQAALPLPAVRVVTLDEQRQQPHQRGRDRDRARGPEYQRGQERDRGPSRGPGPDRTSAPGRGQDTDHRRGRALRCFECGALDHFARECPHRDDARGGRRAPSRGRDQREVRFRDQRDADRDQQRDRERGVDHQPGRPRDRSRDRLDDRWDPFDDGRRSPRQFGNDRWPRSEEDRLRDEVAMLRAELDRCRPTSFTLDGHGTQWLLPALLAAPHSVDFVPVRFVFDTGCSLPLVISTALAARLRLQSGPAPAESIAAFGGALLRVAGVAPLRCRVGDLLLQLDAWIIDAPALAPLFGAQAFASFGTTFTTSPDTRNPPTLTLRSGHQVPLVSESPSSQAGPLIASLPSSPPAPPSPIQEDGPAPPGFRRARRDYGAATPDGPPRAPPFTPAQLAAVRAGSGLDDALHGRLVALLCEYRDLFDAPKPISAACNITPVDLRVPPDAPIPPAPPHIEVPEHYAATARLAVEQGLGSLWTEVPAAQVGWPPAPLFVVQSAGKLRAVVAYHWTTNRGLKYVQHSQVTCDQMRGRLLRAIADYDSRGQKACVALCDLSDAYLSVPLGPGSGAYCRFSFERRVYEPQRLQFGLSSAVSVFQQIMDAVLRPLPAWFSYLDDVMCVAHSPEGLLLQLDLLFSRLAYFGFRLSTKKLQVAKPSATVLGFSLLQNALAIPARTREVLRGLVPTPSIPWIRRFLGAVNYFRDLAPTLARASQPLVRLLRAGAPKPASIPHHQFVRWVSDVLEALESNVQKSAPRAGEVFYMFVDASNDYYAAVLACGPPTPPGRSLVPGAMRLVAVDQHAMNPAQAAYSTYEKELLAVSAAYRAFGALLVGTEATIVSDHQALVSPPNLAEASPRVLRQFQALAAFRGRFVHLSGDRNTFADFCSRAQNPRAIALQYDLDALRYALGPRMPREEPTGGADLTAWTVAPLSTASAPRPGGADPSPSPSQEVGEGEGLRGDATQVRAGARQALATDLEAHHRDWLLREGPLDPFISHVLDDYNLNPDLLRASFEVIEGIVYHLTADGSRLVPVLPNQWLEAALRELHVVTGHGSVRVTLMEASSRFWAPQLAKRVADTVRACHACSVGTAGPRRPGVLQSAAEFVPIRPGERLAVDFVGPLTGCHKWTYLLSIMCVATRFLVLCPCRSTSTAEVVTNLALYFDRFGTSSSVHSDNGGAFTSAEYNQFLATKGVTPSRSPPYRPESNPVERLHALVGKVLRARCNEERTDDWSQFIGDAELAANVLASRVTGLSAYELFFGRRHPVTNHPLPPNIALSSRVSMTSEGALAARRAEVERHRALFHLARELSLQESQDRTREINAHAALLLLHPGDLVVVEEEGQVAKLAPRYHGPFKVAQKLSDLHYTLAATQGGPPPKRTWSSSPVHVSRLRLYHAALMSTDRNGRTDWSLAFKAKQEPAGAQPGEPQPTPTPQADVEWSGPPHGPELEAWTGAESQVPEPISSPSNNFHETINVDTDEEVDHGNPIAYDELDGARSRRTRRPVDHGPFVNF